MWRRVCVKVCVREGVCVWSVHACGGCVCVKVCVCGVYMHVEGVCGGCV